MRTRNYLWMLAALVLFALVLGAEEQPKKEIKHVPIKPTSPASGSEMYQSYCAVCHGLAGKGNGPAAQALKAQPTDLTLLAHAAGGTYPAMKVSSAIRGEDNVPAHGTKDMPVWGKLFWNISSGHEAEVQQRIANLNKYIESLQSR